MVGMVGSGRTGRYWQERWVLVGKGVVVGMLVEMGGEL